MGRAARRRAARARPDAGRRRPARPARSRSATPSACASCSRRPASPRCAIEALELARRHASFEEFWETTLDLSRSFHDAVLARPQRGDRARSRRSLRERFAPFTAADGALDDPGAHAGRLRRAPERAAGATPAAVRIACAPMIYDDDADLTLLDGKTVAIIGYGSQGHAHALNLKDSGVDVVVGLREDSASVAKAREQGLEVLPVVEAASRGDLVMILLPDELHREVWEQEIRDGIAEGNMLLFGHGFSIHYGEVDAAAGRRRRRWSRPRAPATSCAASSPKAAACPA